jgi:hypothetical protein
MYSRIKLVNTNYSNSIPFIKTTLIRSIDADIMQSIYRDYCLYKRFASVMPLFIEEYLYPQSDVIAYFDNEIIVGFTLMFKYNTNSVAAAQFAWNYHKPWMQLGIKSLEYLCWYYKEQGFAYLYLGGDEPYKRQIQGYEICPPME